MAGTKISDATLRSTLKGTEQLPIVDTDLPKGKTTSADLKTYCTPDLSGYAEKAGAEFTGTIAAPIVAFMRESQGMMAAIQADSNNILFRTYNAGVDSITFQVQSSMPLKLTEGGIQENGIPLENKYALLTDLDELATKAEMQAKLDTNTYNQDKAAFATKTELNEKVSTETYNSDKATFALKSEIPSVSGLLTKTQADGYYQAKGDYALKSEIPTDYATTNDIQEAIQDANIEDLVMYGVEFDTTVSSPDCTRIGNMNLHRTLPIQSQMKGCLLNDDGEVIKYLNTSDWTSETRDGSQGQVMVEIPEHYVKFETDGTKRRVKMSITPIVGYKKIGKYYISAYEATVQRSANKLCSVVNTDEDYRGGNNTADWDSTYRSLLGLPATQISRTNFRTYARNRKSGSTEWNCMTYDAQKDLYWLFVVEYATLNTQKAFNSSKTSEGYAQGGLGEGVTTLDWTKWTNFNGNNPFIPCGYTDSLGNGTGEVEYSMPTEYDFTIKKVKVNRYHGIENIFGHMWKWVDGINVRISPNSPTGDGLSKIYVTDNPEHFNDSGYDNMTYIGDEARTDAYVKEIIFGEGGEIMPSVVGGSSTTYFCDYHYTNIPTSVALRGVRFGGLALDGADAGFVCACSDNVPSSSNARIGSRLCFIRG